MADQAGVVHEGILRSVVDTETEGVDAQLDTFAFPPDVFLAVGGDTEKVMVLACEVALSQPDSMTACARITIGLIRKLSPALRARGRYDDIKSTCSAFIFLLFLDTVLIFYKQPLLIIFLLFSPDDLSVFSVISPPLLSSSDSSLILLVRVTDLPQKDFSNHQAEKSKQFLSLFEFSFRPTVHPVSPPRLRKTVCHRPGPGRDVRM